MKFMSIGILAGAALFAAAGVAPSLAADPTPQAAPMMSALTVPVAVENGSGESGTATLSDTADGLKVVLALKGGPAAPQPAHIHLGTCEKLDPKPKYPLTNVVEGASTTVIKDVTVASLLGKYAINVHKSTTDLATYVACGNIAKQPMPKMSM